MTQPGGTPSFPIYVDDDTLRLVDAALTEDRGAGDWTTRWTVPARARAGASVVARAAGVVAGLGPATAVFLRLDPRVDFEIARSDGDDVAAGDVIFRVRGPARTLLTGGRTSLNFLQRLSGIATCTRRLLAAASPARLVATRRTTPGWRALEHEAVAAGGGASHRSGLYDRLLVTAEHALLAGGMPAAVERVRDQNTRGLPLGVEVQSLDRLAEAIQPGVERIVLLDMSDAEIAEAVARVRSSRSAPLLQATSSADPARVRAVAALGVDIVAVLDLTQAAGVLPVTLVVARP